MKTDNRLHSWNPNLTTQVVNEAREYLQLVAELDSNDPRSLSLSDFYRKDTLKIDFCD